jgi:hypothetical protein
MAEPRAREGHGPGIVGGRDRGRRVARWSMAGIDVGFGRWSMAPTRAPERCGRRTVDGRGRAGRDGRWTMAGIDAGSGEVADG